MLHILREYAPSNIQYQHHAAFVFLNGHQAVYEL